MLSTTPFNTGNNPEGFIAALFGAESMGDLAKDKPLFKRARQEGRFWFVQRPTLGHVPAPRLAFLRVCAPRQSLLR